MMFRFLGVLYWASIPPSTTREVPVVNFASSVEAAISGGGEVDHCLNVGIFCNVRANERGGTAELLDFCDDARAFFFTWAGEDDLSASTGKFDGGRLADAGGPSGHECNFV
jgi:hypothetical protein